MSHFLSFTCQMGDLLGRYSDLMDGFNEFLTRCERNGNCLDVVLIMVVFVLFNIKSDQVLFCRWISCWCHE